MRAVEPAGGGPIHKPHENPGRRLNHLSREALRIADALQHLSERVGFFGPRNQEHHMLRGVEKSRGHRHPVGGDRGRILWYDPARALGGHVGAGKERRSMSVRPYAEQHKVERRWRPIWQYAEDARDFTLVGEGGSIQVVSLSLDAVDMSTGNRQGFEQDVVSHPEVRIAVIGRDCAFVAPEELDTIPGHPVAIAICGQKFV